ncbi:MAG: hypothetical protein ACRDPY_30645 [Streptosporangiaceae bacterium]
MSDANQFTIDTGRGYELTDSACVEENLFDIVLSRAGRQPFATGQTEFPGHALDR